RAAQALHRRARCRMGQRHAGRQARRRVHVHEHHARRPGVDVAVDAASAAAPRLRRGRDSLHRTRAQHDPQRRHAVRGQPCRRIAGRSAAQRRRSRARARAGAAGGHAGGEAAMIPAAGPTSAWVLRLALLALVLLYATWFAPDAHWIALGIFALPPLMLALALPRRGLRAAFWAGLLALAWFSHGVMV